MAFNGYKLNYPTQRVVVNNENDEVRSILSDDQSSWVVFNPDSDILSSTTQDRDDGELTDLESEVQSQDHDEDEEEEEDGGDANSMQQERGRANTRRGGKDKVSQRQQRELEKQEEADDEEDTDTDSLIDTFNPEPSQLRLERLFNKSRNNNNNNRITNWNDMDSDLVDDNVASWDLDENLSNNSLDTSILKIKEFYGDELIRGMNRSELREFKKIHYNLRTYLNKKPNPILYQMLLKLYPTNASSDVKGGSSANRPYHLPYQRYLETNLTNHYENDDVTSETASSSLVMCGGGGDNWGDI